MSSLTVWHANEPTWGSDPYPKWNKDEFTLVAVVKEGSLEDAYRLTNHIDKSWWENAGVTPVLKKGEEPRFRSTSVGDVIHDGKRAFRVSTLGFVEQV